MISSTLIYTYEKFYNVPEYLNHKSSCFSCEKDIINRYGVDAAWLGQPTKSFDSEIDGIYQANDISGGFLGKTMKYY